MNVINLRLPSNPEKCLKCDNIFNSNVNPCMKKCGNIREISSMSLLWPNEINNNIQSVNSSVQLIIWLLLEERKKNQELIIHNNKLISERDQYKKQSLIDPLTNIYNRRAFNESLAFTIAEVERTKQENKVLLLLDIDKFKFINDKYWHDIWDEILIHFVKILKISIRKTDLLFRLGWDEFAIIAQIEFKNWLTSFIEKINENLINIPYIDKQVWIIKINVTIWSTNLLLWITDSLAYKKADTSLYSLKKLLR